MEKAEIIERSTGFDALNNRIQNFKNRFYDLVDIALKNNDLKKDPESIIKKISPSKDYDFFSMTMDIYKLLACIDSIIPGYNETWLLYGTGGMFNQDPISQNDNSSIRKRISEIIDFTIKNKRNYFTYIRGWDGVINEDDFIEFIDILSIDNTTDRKLLIKDRFDEEFDHKQNEQKIDKLEDEYEVGCHDIYWLVNKFHTFFASINNLKSIIPGFSETWLLLGKGNMFEQ